MTRAINWRRPQFVRERHGSEDRWGSDRIAGPLDWQRVLENEAARKRIRRKAAKLKRKHERRRQQQQQQNEQRQGAVAKGQSVVVANDGPACPRCGGPTQVREHGTITEKQ